MSNPPESEGFRRAMDTLALRYKLENAKRLEEQARIFLLMGYDVSELTMVYHPWPVWEENIVPKSAISQHEEREREDEE